MAWAQSESDLTAARKLFGEALAAEQSAQYADALEKFERVRAVRDTPAVRYRIATCLEALGKVRAALAMYATTSIAPAGDAEAATIARASREKADALSKNAGRLILTLAATAPPDAAVKVDGETIASNVLGTPLLVDPGPHTVTATATRAVPFNADVTAAAGAEARVEISLPPDLSQPAPPPPVAPTPTAPPPPPPPVSPVSHARTTAGIAFAAAGGALVAGGITIWILRHEDIQSLNASCSNGVCPLAQRDSIESTRNRAIVEGPIGAGLGIAGALAAGVGVYLLLTPPKPPTAAIVTPWFGPGEGGLLVRRAF
ncbi:MAG TPA: hypothetical protein VGI39_02265 [Polyangiaceae bacterium]|jgi:hypothetical protein